MLLIVTTVPAIESLKNRTINSTIPSTPRTSMAANWTEMQKLLASDGEQGDIFGQYVSLSGDTALIGASQDNDNGTMSGTAYVFTRSGTTWTQQQKLFGSDTTTNDRFGTSVSVEGDTALVGAIYGDGNEVDSGSVYVFTRTGSIWTQQTKLIASDGATGDFFGQSVFISGDTALIGAPLDDNIGVVSGSTYVFTRTGTTWSQQAKLLALNGTTYACFGISVSLSGSTALIGASQDNDNGTMSGTAYVFTRNGTTWSQQAKLIASDGAFNDRFGQSVFLSGDTALIGAPLDDDNGADSGSAYVFTRTDTAWTQQQKLLALDGPTGYFGFSVSLACNTALIGAYGGNNVYNENGSAYVFTHNGTAWFQEAKLLASDGVIGEGFGICVSISGSTALIGAYGDDNCKGSAYVFKGSNQPPSPPTIVGPSWGLKNVNYTFCINVTDPNADNIYCKWDWGDGNITEWLGPYVSGETVCVSHAWSQKGIYEMRVKLKDEYGQGGNWSDPHVFNVYELKKAFLFGKYTNLSGQEGYITFKAVNLRMILFNPFQFLHYINGEKITYLEDTAKALILPQFIIGRIDVVV
jgi:hypothetical protein